MACLNSFSYGVYMTVCVCETRVVGGGGGGG